MNNPPSLRLARGTPKTNWNATFTRRAALRVEGIFIKKFAITFAISAGLSVVMLTCADPVAAQKPNPAGIVDLPAAVDALHGIGPTDHHPWQNVNVDGMRIRIGSKDIETQDGVYKLDAD